MNKFNPDKVGKTTLKLCKEIAENEQYVTAPLAIYNKIRGQFTIAKTIEEVATEYPLELVELVHAEVFNKKGK